MVAVTASQITRLAERMRLARTPWGATLVLLVLAAPAQAEWYLTEPQAVLAARHAVVDRYGQHGTTDPTKTGMRDVVARCRPQRRSDAPDGARFHRWVCDWRVEPCRGRMLIAGHSGRLRYGVDVLRGASCSET